MAAKTSKEWVPRAALAVCALAAGYWLATARAVYHPLAGRQMWDKGKAALVTGKPDEALGIAEELLLHYPDDYYYLSLKARALNALGRRAEEAAVGERLWAVGAPHDISCAHLGPSYEALGSVDAALAVSERCAAANPDNPQGLFHLAQLYERAGRLDDAERIYGRLQNSPTFRGARLSVARMRLKQGRAQEAEAIIAEILRRDPEHRAALYFGIQAAEALGLGELLAQRRRALRRGSR